MSRYVTTPLALLLISLARAHNFTYSPGALVAGNDLEQGNHTLSEAVSVCANLKLCKGFTYHSSLKNLLGTSTFYFKSAIEVNVDSTWPSYLRDQPPSSPCPTVKLLWLPNNTQINATSLPNTTKFGLEDGIVVRRADGGFSMVAAEMYTDPKWVRIGVCLRSCVCVMYLHACDFLGSFRLACGLVSSSPQTVSTGQGSTLCELHHPPPTGRTNTPPPGGHFSFTIRTAKSWCCPMLVTLQKNIVYEFCFVL